MSNEQQFIVCNLNILYFINFVLRFLFFRAHQDPNTMYFKTGGGHRVLLISFKINIEYISGFVERLTRL
jgi:hypothetical protein